MQEKSPKIPLTPFEVVFLAILSLIIYLSTFILLREPIEYYVFEEIPTWLVFLVILGFDVAWTIGVCLWPLKNIKVKIVLTVIVLTLSASILTCLYVLHILRGAFA